MKNILLACLMFSWGCFGQASAVENFKITILSTMLSDTHIGEWGFSALIEVGGEKILFDTGSREQTVIQNAAELDIRLGAIENVFLSHNHKDHTGGLLHLKRKFPKSFAKAHVGEGIFYSRPKKHGRDHYLLENKEKLMAQGITFIEHESASQIIPKVWTTGRVPRVHDEKNWSKLGKLIDDKGIQKEDTIPEDQSLFFDTDKGIVLVSGCGHAGLVNTLEQVSKILPGRPIHKIIGGFHLFRLNNEKLEWTARKMMELGVEFFVGAHCTGINSTYAIRDFMKSTKDKVLVASVGTTITKEGVKVGVMQ
ncbi:MAG: MBL fold metallo-hydrolase [Flavobacteriaceae bacterium]